MSNEEEIIVLDIGARYGIHSSWNMLKDNCLLKTYAFDIDSEEVERLEAKYSNNPNYFIYQLGLGEKVGRKNFNILNHKGQSSFFEPNLKSPWFNDGRLDEATVMKRIPIDIVTLDEWCVKNKVFPDFLKVDTEGYDYFVLKGAEKIQEEILGIRCEVHFQDTYLDQPKFDKIYSLLSGYGFQLANIDYNGKGSPQSYFCPNPSRFGLFSGCEVVFIKRENFILSLSPERFFKVIMFLFLNNLEDVAFKYIMCRKELFLDNNDYKMIKLIEKVFLFAVKKLQYIPGNSYEVAKNDYSDVFGKLYPDREKFYEDLYLNPA